MWTGTSWTVRCSGSVGISEVVKTATSVQAAEAVRGEEGPGAVGVEILERVGRHGQGSCRRSRCAGVGGVDAFQRADTAAAGGRGGSRAHGRAGGPTRCGRGPGAGEPDGGVLRDGVAQPGGDGSLPRGLPGAAVRVEGAVALGVGARVGRFVAVVEGAVPPEAEGDPRSAVAGAYQGSGWRSRCCPRRRGRGTGGTVRRRTRRLGGTRRRSPIGRRAGLSAWARARWPPVLISSFPFTGINRAYGDLSCMRLSDVDDHRPIGSWPSERVRYRPCLIEGPHRQDRARSPTALTSAVEDLYMRWSWNRWLVLPVAVHWEMRAPSAVEASHTSRARPLCRLTRLITPPPWSTTRHC